MVSNWSSGSAVLKKIISGGQTGADRAGLDVAIKHGLEHGGAIPLDRRTEDGVLPSIYRLEEMSTSSYPARTEKNVLDGDATIIFSHGTLTCGSRLTREKALEHSKPQLHIDFNELSTEQAVQCLVAFLSAHSVEVLNIAGPRASGDSRIYSAVFTVLEKLVVR